MTPEPLATWRKMIKENGLVKTVYLKADDTVTRITTGPDGNTQIFGVDVTRKWKPAENERGWPFTIWMSEFILRRYWANSYAGPNPANPSQNLALPAETLADWGFYTQWLWGFKPKWAVGLRYEYASAHGDNEHVPGWSRDTARTVTASNEQPTESNSTPTGRRSTSSRRRA